MGLFIVFFEFECVVVFFVVDGNLFVIIIFGLEIGNFLMSIIFYVLIFFVVYDLVVLWIVWLFCECFI